ncbi:MAG TPA: outer membrane beta-barrel protein [Fibrella sp.]
MHIQFNGKIYCGLLLLSLGSSTFAQQSSRYIRPEEPGQLAFTAGAGVANYIGDLNERAAFRRGELGFALTIGINYRITDHLSARAEAGLLQIKGSQRGTRHETNNLSFRSTNPSFSGGLQVDLLPASSKPVVNPYLAMGAGFTYLSPTTRYQDRWVRLPALRTESENYSRLAALAYGGAGLSVRLPPRLLLSVELTYTLPSSDYVDDVSTVYSYGSSLSSTEAILLSDRRPELGLPLHTPGEQRGFARGKDAYLTGLIRVSMPLSSAKERQYRRSVNCIK